jgi:hypothetical protein
MFIAHGLDRREPIDAMPGVDHLSIAHAVDEAGEAPALTAPQTDLDRLQLLEQLILPRSSGRLRLDQRRQIAPRLDDGCGVVDDDVTLDAAALDQPRAPVGERDGVAAQPFGTSARHGDSGLLAHQPHPFTSLVGGAVVLMGLSPDPTAPPTVCVAAAQDRWTVQNAAADHTATPARRWRLASSRPRQPPG